MRAKAELRIGLMRELEQNYSLDDVEDFRRQLEFVREDPIRHSEFYHDPETSRYAFRWFPFGIGREKIAVFSFDGTIMQVMRCKLSKPPRQRNPSETR